MTSLRAESDQQLEAKDFQKADPGKGKQLKTHIKNKYFFLSRTHR